MNQQFGQFGNQMGRIHQNSLFNGAEQSQGFGQERQIHQRTMSGFGGGFGGGASMMSGQSFGGGFGQNYNQGYNQGYQNQVSQNQLDRIQQNSLYNGAEQSQGFGQERQIHQRTMSGQGFGGGFGGGASMMMGGQGFGQNYNQGYNQGYQNQVSQNQLDRIQQNSLYNGAEQSQGFGGGASMMSNQGFGQNYNQGYNQGFQNQGYNQSYNQGFQNQMGQNQMQRIHQNSLYNGQNQSSPQGQFGSFEQRVSQATMQNGMMANPQLENNSFGGGFQSSMMSQGFGGGAGQQWGQSYNGGAFRQVMNADAGMTDSEGPSSYPASMYTGHNQYDTVNQSAFNQINS